MLADVQEVQHRGGYRLYLRFDDGVEGEIDLAEVFPFVGVFAALKDVSEFAKVGLYPEHDTICWPNGADVAPETLYEAVVQGTAAAAAHLRHG
jgi:Protein of unknown function (DUF2442)